MLAILSTCQKSQVRILDKRSISSCQTLVELLGWRSVPPYSRCCFCCCCFASVCKFTRSLPSKESELLSLWSTVPLLCHFEGVRVASRRMFKCGTVIIQDADKDRNIVISVHIVSSLLTHTNSEQKMLSNLSTKTLTWDKNGETTEIVNGDEFKLRIKLWTHSVNSFISSRGTTKPFSRIAGYKMRKGMIL